MRSDGDLAPTPGQTVGPFFGYALPFERGNELVPPTHPGAVMLSGRVLDGAGDPVPDALIEIWQAAADGSAVRSAGSLHRDGRTFTGWGRAATDNTGTYWFTTLRPGVAAGEQLPFFALTVLARGLLDRLFTRAYLPADSVAIREHRFLSSLPSERSRTLMAVADGDDLRFDIRLQGERETVFLRYPDDRR